jgi:hypothetical protein
VVIEMMAHKIGRGVVKLAHIRQQPVIKSDRGRWVR